MRKQKRSAVFVALSNTVGHELVFERYTDKVVVAKYPRNESNCQPLMLSKKAVKPVTKRRSKK